MLRKCCSIALLEPLLDTEAQKRKSWISWKAHVRLAAFVLRFSYDAQRDGELCDQLVNDFDQKFDLAYPPEYRKPKHHCIKHLRKYLALYGPFRNYTCFTGEGFLSKMIKPMFEDCNYKSAAYTVGRRWAMRRWFKRKTGTSRLTNGMTMVSDVLVGSALQVCLLPCNVHVSSILACECAGRGSRLASPATRARWIHRNSWSCCALSA